MKKEGRGLLGGADVESEFFPNEGIRVDRRLSKTVTHFIHGT